MQMFNLAAVHLFFTEAPSRTAFQIGSPALSQLGSQPPRCFLLESQVSRDHPHHKPNHNTAASIT